MQRPTITLTITEQKQAILSAVDFLSPADKIALLKIIVANLLESAVYSRPPEGQSREEEEKAKQEILSKYIYDQKDGVRINLDVINDKIISNIYYFIIRKLEPEPRLST